MAEFCLSCWNRMNNTNLTEKDVEISRELDLCEGCGEIKNVILLYKKKSLLKKYLSLVFRRRQS